MRARLHLQLVGAVAVSSATRAPIAAAPPRARVGSACPREEERGDGDPRPRSPPPVQSVRSRPIVVRPYPAPMALAEELERIAELAGATAVLAAEAQAGERVYLCAFEADGRAHLAGARRERRAVAERRRVRDAVAILALCELAAETAAGGDLDDLRSQLTALRLTENPPGSTRRNRRRSSSSTCSGAARPRHPRAPRRDRRGDPAAGSRSRRRSPGLPVRRGDEGGERGRGSTLQREVESSYRIDLR